MSKPIKTFLFIFILTISFIGGQNALTMAAEAICSGGTSPDSNVIWCDDFEDGTWSGLVQCTGNSWGFQDKCSAYSGNLTFDGYWGHDGYSTEQILPSSYTELHLRMYLYFSDPYPWGSMTDKGIYLRNSSDDSVKIRVMEYSREVETATQYFPGSGKPGIASYAWSGGETKPQNQGNDITFQPGKWYLAEWYVKLNDPGVANGIVKFWVDDASQPITSQTLRLSYNNIQIRNAGNNSGYNMIWFVDYREDCRRGDSIGCPPILNQWVKWDNVVVKSGNNQIGPIGGGTPPPPPSTNKFSLNDRVQVSLVPFNVRATPSLTGAILGTRETIGNLGTVIGGPTASDGYNWWDINYDSGTDGWNAEGFITKYTGTTDTTPPSAPTGLVVN